MISTGELRKGVAIELDGELWQILDYHHIKMGRGSAQVRITLRNIKRGQTVERSFQAGTKWPRASMEKRPVQFLYRDGDDFHFMDNDTYDQFILTAEQLGETAQYLKDGMTLDRTATRARRSASSCRSPSTSRSSRPSPGFAGDTQSGARKPAHDRDRPRRPGPDLRRAGRHDPDRHPDRGVPDPGLGPRDEGHGSARLGAAELGRDPGRSRRPGERLRPVGPGPDAGAAAPGRAGRRRRRPAPSASGSSAVSEVTRAIRGAVRADPRLPTCGSRARSAGSPSRPPGHAYFALKDERNQLQCVWFRDRPGALGVRGAGRAPGRRPRPDRPVRAAGRAPALRRVDPAGRAAAT